MGMEARVWMALALWAVTPSLFAVPLQEAALAGMDTKVQPGDDFYAYANGHWLQSATIAPDHTEVGALQSAVDGMDAKLRTLIEAIPTTSHDTNAGKVYAYYRAFVDTTARHRRGLASVQTLLDEVAHAPDRRALSALMGREQTDFTGSLFDVYVDVDHQVGDRYAAFLSQAGLLMPDRDHYIDARFAAQREALRAYLVDQFEATGLKNASRAADEVMAFEARVAKASWTDDQQVAAAERKIPRVTLASFAPGIDWAAFLDAAQVSPDTTLIVSEPGAAKALAALYGRTPMPVLRLWMTAHVLDRAAPFLDSARVAAWQRFHGQAMAGRQAPIPDWELAIRGVAGTQCVGSGGPSADCFGSLRWAAGDLYVAANFTGDVRKQAGVMIDDLRSAFRRRLASEAWMSPATRTQALKKLDAYTVKLGGPSQRSDLSEVDIHGDDLIGSARSVASWEWSIQRSRLAVKVDPTLWVEAPQSVDANNGSALDVEFPAGLLQPPVFDTDRDAAYNYGAMGAFIGHEWTHGFDDDGRQIDAQNRRHDWWTAHDREAFRRRADQLGRQYDTFEPLPGEHVDGRQTLDENIADLGGLSVALDAYHASLHGQPAPVVDGMTGDQRVLLGWAWLWRGKQTADALRTQLVSGEHAPFPVRVNAVVRNMDAWYDAYGVRAGQRLFLPAASRVRIW